MKEPEFQAVTERTIEVKKMPTSLMSKLKQGE